jgi:hypothetical protein
MEICPICFENTKVDDLLPYNCKHYYHKECIEQINRFRNLKNKGSCMLCFSSLNNKNIIKKLIKYRFNNMLEGIKDFDIDFYLNAWKNEECLNKNHELLIETLGDWCGNSQGDIIFNYKYMIIQCPICNIDKII